MYLSGVVHNLFCCFDKYSKINLFGFSGSLPTCPGAEDSPTANPAKILPVRITTWLWATAIRTHPSVRGRMHNCSTRLRPHLSIIRTLMKLPTGVAAECTRAVDCSSHYNVVHTIHVGKV
jgi:hypothetical protein